MDLITTVFATVWAVTLDRPLVALSGVAVWAVATGVTLAVTRRRP